jgi:glycosyltransferase involved in cell wall biosynthesis
MATQSPGDSIAISTAHGPAATSLVVCSLEPWGEARGRIRILVDEIVDVDPSVEVLYVSPSTDGLRRPKDGNLAGVSGPRLERVHPRIHVLRPRRWLSTSNGTGAGRSVERQVLDAVGELGLIRPLLWINDAAYARFAVRTGWSSLYDISDDWLLAPVAPRRRPRLVANERLLVEYSQAVVACSAELASSRGRGRHVELIPNGVDADMFRLPRSRPADLPPAPVALYLGTLQAEQVDIPLLLELAAARPDLAIALIGPVRLPSELVSAVEGVPTIHLLGPRPYDQTPAFLQHADVVVVPHLVTPLTDHLDPIEAYQCLAVGRRTIATPVAGFRQLGLPIVIAPREGFVEAVVRAIEEAVPAGIPAPFDETPVPSWRQRAESMVSVMDDVRRQRAA